MKRLSISIVLILLLSANSEAEKPPVKATAKNITGIYEVSYKRDAGGLL